MKALLRTGALALGMLSTLPATAWATEVTFPGFEFGCQSADGRMLKPPDGDIESERFTSSAPVRSRYTACMGQLDRLTGSCYRREAFASTVDEAQHPGCGEVFRQQVTACVWQYMADEHKCRVGHDAVRRDGPAQRAWVQSRNFAGTRGTDTATADALSASGWRETLRGSCKVWNPGRVAPDFVTWSGGCESGTAAGTGRLIWHDGGHMHSLVERFQLIYEGEMQTGKAHGHGTATWNNRHEGNANSRYEGRWRQGRPHGYGTYISPDGGRFEGRWFRGCFRGAEGRWVAIGATAQACRHPE